MNYYDSMQRFAPTTIYDNGAMTNSEAWINGGKSVLEGAVTGLQVGGPWGALIGAIGGTAKGITDYTVNRSNAEDAMYANNLKGSIANSQNDIKFADSIANRDRLM